MFLSWLSVKIPIGLLTLPLIPASPGGRPFHSQGAIIVIRQLPDNLGESNMAKNKQRGPVSILNLTMNTFIGKIADINILYSAESYFQEQNWKSSYKTVEKYFSSKKIQLKLTNNYFFIRKRQKNAEFYG